MEDKEYEDMVSNIKMYNFNGYKDLVELENRGITLTKTELTLMFYPRVYGKSFMSYCSIMLEASKKGKFKLSYNEREGLQIDLLPRYMDPDILGDQPIFRLMTSYIQGLETFISKYYPEFNVEISKNSIEGISTI